MRRRFGFMVRLDRFPGGMFRFFHPYRFVVKSSLS